MRRLPSFDPIKSENPNNRLPLLRDSTLVRATQLAILNLRYHAQEHKYSVKQIVENIGGIEKRFCVLVTRGLLGKHLPMTRNQHEELEVSNE